MTKLTVGITLMVFILLVGTGYGYWMVISSAEPLLELLVELQTAVRRENWDTAKEIVLSLEKHWEKVENIWTPLIDHSQVNELENSFTRLGELVRLESKDDALAELAVSKRLVRNVPNTEMVSFKNVF